MRKILLFLGITTFSFLLASPMLAQTVKVIGRVVDDSTFAPLAGANVQLLGSGKGTTTDDEGIFILKTTPAERLDTLFVSFLGYGDYRIPLSKFQNKSVIGLHLESLSLAGVVVSAEQINLTRQEAPHARKRISLSQIERIGSSEISDLFKSTSSVRIEGNDLDGRRIQIRGSNMDEVNVYVDGVLINDIGASNSADLSLLPTESIENIEIIKGGNLTLLGNGAFGGVVYITTKKEQKRRFLLKTKAGSFDSKYVTGEINLPLSRHFFLNYLGQYNTVFPEIEFFPGERFATKSKNKSIESKKQNHQVNLGYITRSGAFNAKFIGYFLDYSKPLWRNNRNNYFFAVSYKGRIFGSKDWEIVADHLRGDDRIDRDGERGALFVSDFVSKRVNVRISKKFSGARSEFQFLTEYFHDELESEQRVKAFGSANTFYQADLYDNRFSAAGMFIARDKLKKYPNVTWKTYLGTRLDLLVNGDKNLTHSVGVELQWRKAHWTARPYFNFGNNIKYPTLRDNAFIRLLDQTPQDTTLKRVEPEYNSSWEGGFSVSFKPISTFYRGAELSFAVFKNTVTNKILRQPFEEIQLAAQTGRNETTGAEISLRFKRLFNRLDVSSSFTGLDISNPRLYPYKSDRNYNIGVEYGASRGLYFSALTFHEGKSTAWFLDENNNIQIDTVPSFNDMDLSVGYRFRIAASEFNLQFTGNNIFDSSGFRFFLLKKRFLQVSLSLRY